MAQLPLYCKEEHPVVLKIEKVSQGHHRILETEVLLRCPEYNYGKRWASWDGGKVLQK